MPNPVKPIPEGYHTITPGLICRDAARAIDFYKKALGAVEIMRMPGPGGKIMHAELKIGDSVVFVNDEFADMGAVAPDSSANRYCSLYLYVEDADAVFNRALENGARVKMPLADQFWGDRYGRITDPFGHDWGIATHKEDVTPEEMQRRMAAFMSQAAGQS
ncbi:MAG TPA: VOC family protein [Candidatus Acidoferrales bacterium]|nr:VOC family protein [Candidatus Acidoferrales bacterium]